MAHALPMTVHSQTCLRLWNHAAPASGVVYLFSPQRPLLRRPNYRLATHGARASVAEVTRDRQELAPLPVPEEPAAPRPFQHGLQPHESGAESPSTSAPSQPGASLRAEAQQDQVVVADKLIAVFQAKPPADWRKLIAFSKLWPTLHDPLFKRIRERAGLEGDPGAALALRKLGRRLRAVHDELQEYEATLDAFQSAPAEDWEAMVAARRTVLTADFFAHVQNKIGAAHADSQHKGSELLALARRVATLADAFDRVARDGPALDAAAQEFDALLQSDSLVAAEARIDELAREGRLDPALLLTMAKAYAAAKESSYVQEEVKDTMVHLFWKAKESFEAMQPAELRILKHLLAEEDPRRRAQGLRDAFDAGPALAVAATTDYVSTTPEAMLKMIDLVLQSFDRSWGPGSMLGKAASIVNPTVLTRMKELQDAIRKDFL